MAVQQITNKRIIKYDTNSPNFKPSESKKIKEEVNGNLKENYEEDVYGENVYKVPMEQNGNLKLEEMMSKMMGKIDGINGSSSQTGTEVVEVDIKKEIAIGKVDMSAVKSEEIKGKVNNKLDKLKALRNRRK
tara:strand:+ start:281 stop:676 length:396 start_codon:yes stop_codon:yes gene_type:complete